jgi:predicted nucleotidyltransferase
MILKPQDVVVLLKLAVLGSRPWTYQRLAEELSMSQSEAHAGVRRAVAARLMNEATTGNGRLNHPALKEFLIHGVRYAYPPKRGGLTRGMPTGYAAPPLNKVIVGSSDPPPVWPYAQGTVRGMSFEPLYPSVPVAAERDPKLYELLALVDAMRDGRARERNFAMKEFEERIDAPVPAMESARLQSDTTAPTLHSPSAAYAVQKRYGELNVERSRLADLCRRYGVRKLSLFGSAARGDMTPESDIDLMVEFAPDSKTSLFDLPAMQEELSALFENRRVDIATPEILENPFRRRAITPDLKTLYAA